MKSFELITNDPITEEFTPVEDDLTMAHIDSKIVYNKKISRELQNDVVNFASTLILEDEVRIFNLLNHLESTQIVNIMCNYDNPEEIFRMIKISTECYFNGLVKDLKDGAETKSTEMIRSMAERHDYGIYALINTIFNLKFYCHLSIERDVLDVDNGAVGLESTLTEQINLFLEEMGSQILEYFDTREDGEINKDQVFVIDMSVVEAKKDSKGTKDV